VTDLASGLRFSKRHTKDFEAFRNKRLSEFDRAISFKKQKSRRNRYEMDSDIEKVP
jgi:L-asparaginase/Glu-tRNA(Gln) amidotransferase subunit D